MRLLDLPDWLKWWGLEHELVRGWQTRGLDFPATPSVVIWHHTATPRTAPGDYPSLRVVRDGRSDLPGPLSQVGLGRSGKVYVVAAGKANHAGRGRWRNVELSSRTVGIEAESPGDGSWTPAQRWVYPLLAAALHDGLNSPATLSCGHWEWALPAGRKVDPRGIDMNAMRRTVDRRLTVGPPRTNPIPAQPPPIVLEDDMLQLITVDGVKVYATDGTRTFHVRDQTHLGALRKAKVVRDGQPIKVMQADLDALTQT